MFVSEARDEISFTLLFDSSMYWSAEIPASGETSVIWLLARLRYWMFLRSFKGAILLIWFFARSSEARLLHLSRPVRSLICMLAPLIVERLATSPSVIGLLLSRFSKTNLRTAFSRFLSGKMEISVLLVVASVLFVSAARPEVRSNVALNAVQ